jgi:hypothetical protein
MIIIPKIRLPIVNIEVPPKPTTSLKKKMRGLPINTMKIPKN